MNNDITLPVDLATCGFSLEEIGAIFVMFSSLKINNFEHNARWCMDPTYRTITEGFLKSGVITNNDGELTIDIPMVDNDQFWSKLHTDANGNDTYSHDSLYPDCIYEAIPCLKNNAIVWDIYHTTDGLMTTCECLEEAEKDVIGLLKDEWGEILKK